MPIPEFRADGYLPEGVHLATEAEVLFRFGPSGRRRRALAIRLRHWLVVARAVGARRVLLDGSFVTAKQNPGDLDIVILLGEEFEQRLQAGEESAVELDEALTTRYPDDLFAAEDDTDWREWVDFFTQTREPDGRRKGVVEVLL